MFIQCYKASGFIRVKNSTSMKGESENKLCVLFRNCELHSFLSVHVYIWELYMCMRKIIVFLND